jgi:hypothetical protein
VSLARFIETIHSLFKQKGEYKMSIISMACTANGVSIVHTTAKKHNFSILFHERFVVVPGKWASFVQSIDSVLQSIIKAQKPSHYVIVKAATGRYSAGADTFKAEGFVEYVLEKSGLPVTHITKQSLPKALSCPKGEQKWQDKAKQMFNSENTIKGFKDGYDAACAGAFSKAV